MTATLVRHSIYLLSILFCVTHHSTYKSSLFHKYKVQGLSPEFSFELKVYPSLFWSATPASRFVSDEVTAGCLCGHGGSGWQSPAATWSSRHSSPCWHTVKRKPDTKTQGRTLSFRIWSKQSHCKSNDDGEKLLWYEANTKEKNKKYVGISPTFSKMAFNSVGSALRGRTACKTISKHLVNTTFI